MDLIRKQMVCKKGILSVLLLCGWWPIGAQQTDTLNNLTVDEVVVTGSRNAVSVRHLPMTVSVVGRNKIEKRYEQSLLPLLTEQVPGLFVTGRGIMGYGVSTGAAGGMSVRGVGGSPTTGLQVLIDGHPQFMGLMGHPLADAYQSMLAEKVEVVSGPASVLYGSNAMGGVVNIVTRKSTEDGVHTDARLMYGSFNTADVGVTNRVRNGKFSSVVALNYNRTDGHRPDMGFSQYGGYAKFGYDIHRAWNLFADVNVTHFNASNPGTLSAPLIDNDSRVTRGMTSVSLENNYEKTLGALKFFFNWGRHNIDDGYAPGSQPLDYLFNSKDRMLGITWYQSVALFKGNKTTFGLDYQRSGGEAWRAYADRRTDLVDKTLNDVAGYVDFRQQLGDVVTLNAGIRADNNEKSGLEWIPQVGAAVSVAKNAVVKAIVSKGFRNPTIREMYMFPPQNPDLLPEALMNYELSFSHTLPESRLSYRVNLFYINGRNIIQTLFVDGRPKNVNTGKIENFGVEAVVDYRVCGPLSLSANYAWLHMKNKVTGAPEHKLYVGADYSRKKWNVSTGVQYIHHLYTSVSPVATDSFVLWNLRGAYRVCDWVELFVRGENLLGQQYEINAGYPMPKAVAMGGANFRF